MLRHYPLKEIMGFKTDVGTNTFAFTWKPAPSHPGESIIIYSAKYVRCSSSFLILLTKKCLAIHDEINAQVAEVLRKRHVENPEIVIQESGTRTKFS